MLTLKSFNAKPSYHNRAGRIDRSACLELRTADILPHLSPIDYRTATHADLPLPTDLPLPIPILLPKPLKKQNTSPGSLAEVAFFNLSTRFLLQVHRTRLPRPLAGDHRTRKSNCMKSRYSTSDPPHQPATNPNRGATQLKLLGLPLTLTPLTPNINTAAPWSQLLTILRYEYLLNNQRSDTTPNHRRRIQHYFLCPTCHTKCMKLFLPLCTSREIHDAALAQQWLNRQRLDPRTRNRPGSPAEAALIKRYAILFHPRQLQCRTCLGLRYGESKRTPTPRQSP